MKFYKPALKRTLYLHSNKANITTNGAGKNNTYTWIIPTISINEIAELQIASISSINASSTAIYTFRLREPMAYGNTLYSSDGGSPIIFSLLLNNLNSTFRDDYGIIIAPQIINSISIQTSDDINDMDGGIATNISFVLCILINEFQIQLEEISNPLLDANEQVKRDAFNSFYK